MSPIDAIVTCFRKSFVFSGRARRSEFFWFYLFVLIVSAAAMAVDLEYLWMIEEVEMGPASMAAILATALASLSVGWRRFHDIGLPGWWSVAATLLGPALIGAALTLALVSLSDFVIVADVIKMGSSAPGVIDAALLSVLMSAPLLMIAASPGSPRTNRYGPPLGGAEAQELEETFQ